MTRDEALEWAKLVEGQSARVAEDKLIKGVARALIEAEADLAIAKEALERTDKALIEISTYHQCIGVNSRHVDSNCIYCTVSSMERFVKYALSKLNKRGLGA